MIRYHLAKAEPSDEPLTVQDCRRYLRIDHNSEDEDLRRWITAARAAVEAYTSLAAAQRAVTVYRSTFPLGRDALPLPVKPVHTITSINYLDQDENSQSLDVSTVKLQNTYLPSLVPEEDWPATATVRDDAVTIVVDAGYAMADCPNGIKMAMLAWIGAAYENRGDTDMEQPPSSFFSYLLPYALGDEFEVYA